MLSIRTGSFSQIPKVYKANTELASFNGLIKDKEKREESNKAGHL